jgi:hypothetical protein
MITSRTPLLQYRLIAAGGRQNQITLLRLLTGRAGRWPDDSS